MYNYYFYQVFYISYYLTKNLITDEKNEVIINFYALFDIE
jgi:hypothetical protein